MSEGPAFRQQRYHWVHFVGRSGAAGERWARLYDAPEGEEVRRLTRSALRLLLARRTAEGERELERLAHHLRSLAGLPPSLRAIHHRWYYGARAYCFYCMLDFVRAESDLGRAEASVVEAIERDRFLLPAAQECPDFPHQRIRIARNRRRWDEMARQIDIERGMMCGERPLCVLSSGEAVRYDDLRPYFAALPLDAEERSYAESFLDAELRCAAFERSARGLYALGHLVIPYP